MRSYTKTHDEALCYIVASYSFAVLEALCRPYCDKFVFGFDHVDDHDNEGLGVVTYNVKGGSFVVSS